MTENSRIQHWKRNENVWRKGKQVKEDRTLKMRFRQAMARLKEGVGFDFEDEEFEDSD